VNGQHLIDSLYRSNEVTAIFPFKSVKEKVGGTAFQPVTKKYGGSRPPPYRVSNTSHRPAD